MRNSNSTTAAARNVAVAIEGAARNVAVAVEGAARNVAVAVEGVARDPCKGCEVCLDEDGEATFDRVTGYMRTGDSIMVQLMWAGVPGHRLHREHPHNNEFYNAEILDGTTEGRKKLLNYLKREAKPEDLAFFVSSTAMGTNAEREAAARKRAEEERKRREHELAEERRRVKHEKWERGRRHDQMVHWRAVESKKSKKKSKKNKKSKRARDAMIG